MIQFQSNQLHQLLVLLDVVCTHVVRDVLRVTPCLLPMKAMGTVVTFCVLPTDPPNHYNSSQVLETHKTPRLICTSRSSEAL